MLSAEALPSSWEELPPDLLGLVLLHLPSLADRVRLHAVCRSWRAGAAAQRHKHLPPPLPWLALRDGGLVSLDGAPVCYGSIVRQGVNSYRVVDNLAFLMHDDCSCSLMNPLSGVMLPLPGLAAEVLRELEESRIWDRLCFKKTFVKVVLSSPLGSAPHPHVAIIFMEATSVAISDCKREDATATSFSICGCATKLLDAGEGYQGPRRFDDIAFLHGKLYMLTS